MSDRAWRDLRKDAEAFKRANPSVATTLVHLPASPPHGLLPDVVPSHAETLGTASNADLMTGQRVVEYLWCPAAGKRTDDVVTSWRDLCSRLLDLGQDSVFERLPIALVCGVQQAPRLRFKSKCPDGLLVHWVGWQRPAGGPVAECVFGAARSSQNELGHTSWEQVESTPFIPPFPKRYPALPADKPLNDGLKLLGWWHSTLCSAGRAFIAALDWLEQPPEPDESETPAGRLQWALQLLAVCFANLRHVKEFAKRRTDVAAQTLANHRELLRHRNEQVQQRQQAGTAESGEFLRMVRESEQALDEAIDQVDVPEQVRFLLDVVEEAEVVVEIASRAVRKGGAAAWDAADGPGRYQRTLEFTAHLESLYKAVQLIEMGVKTPRAVLESHISRLDAEVEWFEQATSHLRAASAVAPPGDGESLPAANEAKPKVTAEEVCAKLLVMQKRGEKFTTLEELKGLTGGSLTTVKKAVDMSPSLKQWAARGRAARKKKAIKGTSLQTSHEGRSVRKAPLPDAGLAESEEREAALKHLLKHATPERQRAWKGLSEDYRQGILSAVAAKAREEWDATFDLYLDAKTPFDPDHFSRGKRGRPPRGSIEPKKL